MSRTTSSISFTVPMPTYFFRPKWIAIHVLVITLIVVMLNLADWQWSRHNERKAFNTTPAHFSFPGQWGTGSVVRMLNREYGMRTRTLYDGILRRIYHCDDGWCRNTFWLCRNAALDIF